jgi:hypothetical protein
LVGSKRLRSESDSPSGEEEEEKNEVPSTKNFSEMREELFNRIIYRSNLE